MAPTPIGTSHVLSFGYAVDGLTHHTRFLVDAVASADSTGFSLHSQIGADQGLSAVITAFIAVWEALMDNSATADGVTLYEVVSGTLIPKYSGSWSFTGSAGTYHPASQHTIVLRDGLNKIAKQVIVEIPSNVPYRVTSIASLPTSPLKTYLLDMTDNSNGHIGSWMKSRADGFPDRFISIVGTLNRKIRRRRGIA